MSQQKFKTNIKCSGCLAKVTPYLNEAEEIKTWSVDLENPDKTLLIETDKLLPEEVIALVNEAGFTATEV